MEYTNEYEFCKHYLLEDEYIVWKGKPQKGHLITSKDIVMIPFSIVWCLFTIVWEGAAFLSGASIFFAIWGLPFIAVGFYMLFGRFIYAASMRTKTLYVVTNKKIIAKVGNHIKVYDGKTLPPMDIEIHKNGNGTITFIYDRGMRNGKSYTDYFAMENLEDVMQAQNAINRIER